MRKFGDELEQLHGPSSFTVPYLECQLGGVAPAERFKVCGYINEEREVNRMVASYPLRRAPDMFKRLAVHVCEILRSSGTSPRGLCGIGSYGLRRSGRLLRRQSVGEERGPFPRSTT
jgi:hypothetical protein